MGSTQACLDIPPVTCTGTCKGQACVTSLGHSMSVALAKGAIAIKALPPTLSPHPRAPPQGPQPPPPYHPQEPQPPGPVWEHMQGAVGSSAAGAPSPHALGATSTAQHPYGSLPLPPLPPGARPPAPQLPAPHPPSQPPPWPGPPPRSHMPHAAALQGQGLDEQGMHLTEGEGGEGGQYDPCQPSADEGLASPPPFPHQGPPEGEGAAGRAAGGDAGAGVPPGGAAGGKVRGAISVRANKSI
ncbi:hypothetical protein V8C86DRAFT_2533636, partial [Haematococcus lacustris]